MGVVDSVPGQLPPWLDDAGRPVLIVHAHPDDEVFATAAASAWLASTGTAVVLAVATAGEAAELALDPSLDEAAARQARAARLERSCAALGVAEQLWLGGPGRWVDDGATGSPRGLAAAGVEQVAAAVSALLARWRPHLVMAVGSDGLTGHPDHVLVHRAVAEATRRFHPRPRVLGAQVRSCDVAAAHRSLAPLLAGTPVGSGRLLGCARSHLLAAAVAPSAVGEARRRALDAYTQGLGSAPLPDLLRTYPGRGDSLLLRALFDATGWHIDHYETEGTGP